MKRFTVLFLFFQGAILSAQVDSLISSNEWYFSKKRLWMYNAEYIKSKSISNIKEHLTKNDSLILMSDYTFNQDGFLTEVKNYDVHGNHTSNVLFKLDESGNVLKYLGERGWTAVTAKPKASVNVEMRTVRIVKKRWVIDKNYSSDGRLELIKKKKFNSDSLMVAEIVDRRVVVKKNHLRKMKKSPFIGHEVMRYRKTTFVYSKNGQLEMIKRFNKPYSSFSKKIFTYSRDGVLVRMDRVRKSMPNQTWVYEVRQH